MPAPPSSAAARASPPEGAPAAELKAAFASWTRATNSADRPGLEQLYAPNLSLYGRIVSRADAVQRKLKYVAEHADFAQSVANETWEVQGQDRIVRFRKTSISRGAKPSTVDAYLLWREFDHRFRILDEGDVQSARKLEAKLETQRANWVEKPYDCPACSDPEFGDDPPYARAPLGPDVVKASGAVPPGAPENIAYGRVTFPRFASAVDVPLFLTATPQSGNGDGRWFYYDAPDAAAKAGPNHESKDLLYCAIGGFFAYEPPPANAKPDPGHAGEPKISFRSLLEKRDGELYYERYLYGADGVLNFVYCTFDPAYEAYFYAIVQRMGHSMRVISGGQAGRVSRSSLPYVPFDP